MGYFPIMLGLGAAFFMWFAVVSQSLKNKFQAVLRTQALKKQHETEVLASFEQVFAQLKKELGANQEILTDLLILQNQSHTHSVAWYEEIAKELETILGKTLVSQALGKKIEHLLKLINEYKPILQQYRKAVFFYEELLTSGMARVPARMLGYRRI